MFYWYVLKGLSDFNMLVRYGMETAHEYVHLNYHAIYYNVKTFETIDHTRTQYLQIIVHAYIL